MRFVVRALDAQRRLVATEVEASDEAAAREMARDRGYTVLSLRARNALFAALRRKDAFPATLFSIELLALLDAGLNVVEALQALAEKYSAGVQREVLKGLLESLRRGESLSQAVASHPAAFSPLYVATIRSSERTGNLKEALGRYVAYEEELERVRKKLMSALLYPAILIVAGSLVISFLILYVVPRFAKVYEDMSADLPFFSSLLLWTGRWIDQNGIAAAIALGILFAACAYVACSERYRAAFVTQLWRIPAIGERMRVYQLARFYRTVGMLLRAGIPALKAFDMVAGLLTGTLRAQLERAATLVKEGKPLSTALGAAGLTTPIAARMLAVGERSGQMGELMDRAARFCDEETARWLDAFTRVFEPMLMAALGLVVGGIVILMYMPVFELAGSLQ
jgi:general secretion pathway protein F